MNINRNCYDLDNNRKQVYSQLIERILLIYFKEQKNRRLLFCSV